MKLFLVVIGIFVGIPCAYVCYILSHKNGAGTPYSIESALPNASEQVQDSALSEGRTIQYSTKTIRYTGRRDDISLRALKESYGIAITKFKLLGGRMTSIVEFLSASDQSAPLPFQVGDELGLVQVPREDEVIGDGYFVIFSRNASSPTVYLNTYSGEIPEFGNATVDEVLSEVSRIWSSEDSTIPVKRPSKKSKK